MRIYGVDYDAVFGVQVTDYKAMVSGSCKLCGAWSYLGQQTKCADCKREAKRVLVACAFEGCGETFQKSGTNKRCLKHRGVRVNGRGL